MATEDVGGEPVDHTAAGHGIDGLCLLAVVSGSAATRVASATAHRAGPDDVLVTISATEPGLPGRGFHADATSLDALHNSWNQLVLGARGALT